MPERILIIGATSGIGQAIAQQLAQRGAHLVLAARDTAAAQRIADDLHHRYQNNNIAILPFEATHFDTHPDLLTQTLNHLGAIDGVIACQGYMADQTQAFNDFKLAHRMIDVNYTATVSILNIFANHLAQQKKGYICGVSSVAGDRGRQSNFLYGSTKAAMTAYLSGLRNHLFKSNVHVLTVKPGFVDTAMTFGLINPNSPIVAAPQKVADDILRAIDNQKNTLYTPRFWRLIMTFFKYIPESIFKRLST